MSQVRSQEVDVYSLSGDSQMVLNGSFPDSLPDKFSICIFFSIDKFGEDGKVSILTLKQSKACQDTVTFFCQIGTNAYKIMGY